MLLSSAALKRRGPRCRRWLAAGLGAALVLMLAAGTASAMSRIEDIAAFEGVRDNRLAGYGLVVGLNGTATRSTTRRSRSRA
jgi:flagellar basal body P-ring protein FlgI